MNVMYSKNKILTDITITWIMFYILFNFALIINEMLFELNYNSLSTIQKKFIFIIVFISSSILVAIIYRSYIKRVFLFLNEDYLICKQGKIKVKYSEIIELQAVELDFKFGIVERIIQLTLADGEIIKIRPNCTDEELDKVIKHILKKNTTIKIPFKSSEIIYIKKSFSPYRRWLIVIYLLLDLSITFIAFAGSFFI